MTGTIILPEGSTPPNPNTGYISIFVNASNQLAYVTSTGSIYIVGGTITISFQGLTLNATAAGTTTLTATSTYEQIFQGTTTQTCVLPVVSTLSLGQSFWLKNESTGIVTVNSSGGNLVVSLNPGDCALVTCILITGTTAASWDLQINAQRGGDPTQTFLVAPATLATQAVQAGQTIGRNVVVNGACSVAQVNGGTLITPATGTYPIDNCQYAATQASKLQTQQVSALNSLGAVAALTTSVLAQYTPISTDVFNHSFPIEGLDFARFQYGTANAKAGSLQFKARASVAGTYSGSIKNYASTRSYPFSFVLAANTDTLITLPNIPGDTGGSWVGATNAGAAYIVFDLGGGTTYKSTAGPWRTGNYQGVTGAPNLVAQTNGSTLTITDVQFEVGSFCTTFDRKLYRQVLADCQRYYQQSFPNGVTPAISYSGNGTCAVVASGSAGGAAAMLAQLQPQMLAAPTVTIYSSDASGIGYFSGAIPAVSDFIGTSQARIRNLGTVVTATAYTFNWTASARI